MGLPRWLSGKEPACQCRRLRNLEFDPWVGKIPWRREWQPTPIFLPGESHGRRSQTGYSPWGRRVTHNWATEHACPQQSKNTSCMECTKMSLSKVFTDVYAMWPQPRTRSRTLPVPHEAPSWPFKNTPFVPHTPEQEPLFWLPSS